MILHICSLYDKRTETYGTPFFVNHIQMAIRSFEEATTNPTSFIHNAPTDYVLYKVGTFNDGTGHVTSTDPVVIVQNKPE